jgi:iron complex transport system permease protein
VSAAVTGRSAPPVAGRRALRAGPVSGVWRPRLVGVVGLGVVLTVLVGALGVGLGDFPISLGDVLTVLLGGGTRGQQFVILDLRLPRTLAGALVGAALGVSGAITQAVARNPLASPDILGVTQGATVGAVAAIVLGGAGLPALASGAGLPVVALVGGLLAAAAVYLLAYRSGIEGNRLVLVGVGVGAVCTSVTSWLLVTSTVQDAARAKLWLTGSLSGRGWEHVVPVAVALAVLVPAALLLVFGLSALQLGDDAATGLGVRADRVRGALLLLAVLLAAVATSSAGPVVFVALVVPQVAQRLAGGSRPPLLASAVFGALLLVTADFLARTAFPTEQPVGIVTALIGAPYLLYLLARRNRRVTA